MRAAVGRFGAKMLAENAHVPSFGSVLKVHVQVRTLALRVPGGWGASGRGLSLGLAPGQL